MKNFNKWLDTFIEEKGLDLNHIFEVETDDPLWGTVLIPLSAVVEAAKTIPEWVEQDLIYIDYLNGDVMHYFKFLAEGMTKHGIP